MTVKELIDILQQAPPDREVVVNMGFNHDRPIESVDLDYSYAVIIN